jgi:hypothetical protein
MPRPLTRTQALQNRAFLKLLRRTGNVRLACRELGLKYGTIQHRRRVHPGFAVRVEAALVFANARFAEVGKVGPAASRPRCSPLRPTTYKTKFAAARRRAPSTIHSSVNGPPPRAGEDLRGGRFRTRGGELALVRTRDGLQMRRAQPGKLTREGEQAYLAALCATCNKRLAAAAVGAAGNAFARRRRKDPAFAREERMALREGYQRLELALLATGLPGGHEHDDWRSNDPPPIPPMTANQALQLLYLHQKEARLNAVEPHEIRRRAREPEAAYHERLVRMAEERLRREREKFAVAEGLRAERGEPAWGPAGEAVRRELGLPDLAQVTGWSRADPAKVPHDARRALFGGWRMEQMALRQAQDEREKGPSQGT